MRQVLRIGHFPTNRDVILAEVGPKRVSLGILTRVKTAGEIFVWTLNICP